MVKTRYWLYGILVLAIIGVIFVSGCINKEIKEKDFIKIDVKQQSNVCPPEFVDAKSPHPNITQVSETWEFDSEVIEAENSPIKTEEYVLGSMVAPEIVKIGNIYKMFVGAEELRDVPPKPMERKSGIALFISKDLDTWIYKGIIIENDEGYHFSHPWILELENGYRLFYQVNKENTKEGAPSHFSIWSAYSPDGENWEKEGIVIGESDWLISAAHGRAQKLDNNKYIMVFSVTLKNNCPEPSSIVVARSTDGKNWDVQEEPLALYGHDPTIVYENGILKIYYKYLDKKFFYIESSDKGETFSQPKLVVFLDENGKNTLENPNIEGEGFPADIDYDGLKYMWAQNHPREKMMFARFVREKK